MRAGRPEGMHTCTKIELCMQFLSIDIRERSLSMAQGPNLIAGNREGEVVNAQYEAM